MKIKSILKKNRLFAIIIPTYNGEKEVVECIKSLKNLVYKNFVIVVVDNHSTDNTLSIIKNRFRGITILKNKTNKGFSAACNKGINFALKKKAWAIALLNQDVVVEQNFLSEASKILSDNNVGLACPKIVYGFTNKIWWVGSKLYRGKEILLSNTFRLGYHLNKGDKDDNRGNKIKESDYITGCAMLTRLNTVKRVGMLDEDFFMYAEDIDWSLRIRKLGLKLICFPSTTVHHMVKKGGKKKILSKIKKALNFLESAGKCVIKNYTFEENVAWFLKLPLVLPLELMNFKNME